MAEGSSAVLASRHPRRTPKRPREARDLARRALRLVGFLVLAYLVLKLVPGLESAFEDLRHVSLLWVLAAMAVETLSEMGFVISWQGILDPGNLLRRGDRGKHLGARVAWAQLGGAMLVPGGTISSMGVGAWILHRLGLPMERVGERQLTLMFLNTAVDALALVFFGLGLAVGVFGGESHLTLTLLPAAIVVAALAGVLLVVRRARRLAARLASGWPRVAQGIAAFAAAIENTRGILRHRGGGAIVLGAIAYLGFDMAVLQSAFIAIDAHTVPSFAVVSLCYLIGGLGGSIPLPANLGAVGGIAGMLIAFGVGHNDAVAAVVLYQAIGLLVPLVGGGIAYLFLRREFDSSRVSVPEGREAAPECRASLGVESRR